MTAAISETRLEDIREIVVALGGVVGRDTSEAGWQDDLADVLAELDRTLAALAAAEAKAKRAEDLVRRAAYFVEAVCVMAEDRAPSLGWLADAAAAVYPVAGVRLPDGTIIRTAASSSGEGGLTEPRQEPDNKGRA